MAKKHPLQVPKKLPAPKAAKRRGMAPTHLAAPIDQTSGDRRFVVRCRDWQNVWASNLPAAEAIRVKELVAARGMSRTVRYEDMPTDPELLALCTEPRAQPHGFPAVATASTDHLSSREDLSRRIPTTSRYPVFDESDPTASLRKQTDAIMATLTPREQEILRTRFGDAPTPAPHPGGDGAAIRAIEERAIAVLRGPAQVAAQGAAAAANARHEALQARRAAMAEAEAKVAAAKAALAEVDDEDEVQDADVALDPLADELAGSAVADIVGVVDDDDLGDLDDVVAPGA